MSNVEWVRMPGRHVLLDHSHALPHMLVVLEGAVHEDGRVFRPGDIRLSSAHDRHFIRFIETSRCLVVEGDVPDPGATVRRVLQSSTVFAKLQSATSSAQVADLVTGHELSDAVHSQELPAWLQELERLRLDGAFVRAASVRAIARLAGVSREHLTRCYQRQFGTTVVAAIRAARLRRAFDGLQRSAGSIADVADACGFADQSHLTRQFAEWIGTTPGQVRRRSRADVTSVQDSSAAEIV
jgi:AraC-like DNA-binding protein